MTTNKSKEEKRQMFFDMQEHPDRYTDEQVEELLADEDVKEFFHDMAMVRMAQQKANPKKVDLDEAWKRFVSKQSVVSYRETTTDEQSANRFSGSVSIRFKIAASIIGVVFLSGITFAAIHSGVFGSSSSDDNHPAKMEQTTSTMVDAKQDETKANATEKSDSLDLNPVVFDNAELGTVMSQLAAFYHVKVEFENAASQHIRIFFNWDKTKTLQRNLEILNAFERIQITYSSADETLKVE